MSEYLYREPTDIHEITIHTKTQATNMNHLAGWRTSASGPVITSSIQHPCALFPGLVCAGALGNGQQCQRSAEYVNYALYLMGGEDAHRPMHYHHSICHFLLMSVEPTKRDHLVFHRFEIRISPISLIVSLRTHLKWHH